MGKDKLFIGQTELKNQEGIITGSYVDLDGERFFKIENYHLMPDFFMSGVSNADHWMFISSNGALTAGRKNPDHAIFPYYTDDKIMDTSEITGSKTIIKVTISDKTYLWEPFSIRFENQYRIQRNIYKNTVGNKILFEEINADLGLIFKYTWLNSEKFGFVKKSELINTKTSGIKIEILDGIQNLIPHGTIRVMQNQYSTLVDAYKRNELLKEAGIGIYYLNSIPTDMAEPSEGLKATVAWSYGIKPKSYLISSKQLTNFRSGLNIKTESETRAERGAYFIHCSYKLAGSGLKTWHIVIDTGKDIAEIREIEFLLKTKATDKQLEEDIRIGTENLIKLVTQSDGIQNSQNERQTSRHFSNVLFNIMRGGIYANGTTIQKADFLQHVNHFNKNKLKSCSELLDRFDNYIDYNDLLKTIEEKKDSDLIRICMEYLPLTFSRRHGDPSRPWNLFSIETRNEDGSERLYYQGNWRDIFQNWEALCLSYPTYIESLISKFLNATTADGYNPYRITKDGFEWEKPDPVDPWSNIGYWGDHQIIYLLKLLELSAKYHPGKLQEYIHQEIFVYAIIPYKIKDYEDLIIDPRNTIVFDEEMDKLIVKRVDVYGQDGKLQLIADKPVKVNFTEKILVILLAKLANFVPGGGIWMNTQRPEWNDANNALVGNGISMVTLYYLRCFIVFCHDLFNNSQVNNVDIALEVYILYETVFNVLKSNSDILQAQINQVQPKKILESLGKAAGSYRKVIYRQGFSGQKKHLEIRELLQFFDLIEDYLDHTIDLNKREDGLYHSYNLMWVKNSEGIRIKHLYEMLEGQVAVLSSGRLRGEEAVQLLERLKQESLYRKNQKSYLLYPDRRLQGFMEKNTIPMKIVLKSEILKRLLSSGNKSIIIQDNRGAVHFNGEFRNSGHLSSEIDNLNAGGTISITKEEKDYLVGLFEEIFDHQSFTGRSGTFFGYEGLGCIYWHMVSKLALAVQENYLKAINLDSDQEIVDKLGKYYYEIKAGIGAEKLPQEYGAFPSDPYSHTPGNAGVQQPGMTGQVKEDILTRFGELGVIVENGQLKFSPTLLKKSEFVENERQFYFYDLKGEKKLMMVSAGSIFFTYCQVPVFYILSEKERLEIYYSNRDKQTQLNNMLDTEQSSSIFERKGLISAIKVYINL